MALETLLTSLILEKKIVGREIKSLGIKDIGNIRVSC